MFSLFNDTNCFLHISLSFCLLFHFMHGYSFRWRRCGKVKPICWVMAEVIAPLRPAMCHEYKLSLRGKIEPRHLTGHRRAASLADTGRHPHMHQHTLQVDCACGRIADCGRIESEPFWELGVLAVRTVNFLCRSDLCVCVWCSDCAVWSIHEFV